MSEMLKLNKLLNQALYFGNFLILIRNCGRQAEPCGDRVPSCETHLSPSEILREAAVSLAEGDSENPKTFPAPTDSF